MKVLIIDDDTVVRKAINRLLASTHSVETAIDGEAGIETAIRWKPDVILLDVEMPGKNGYEVCELLKSTPETRDAPVLFLSSHSSLRQRLQGYEVGGDDYLVKPCDADELKAKLLRLGSLHEARLSLASQVKDASRAAVEAMTTSSELGRAIRYVEATYDCSTKERLARELLALLRDFNLKCTVMFDMKDDISFYSHGSDLTPPLESSLIKQLHNQKRFFDFGCRTLVSYPQVGLLVKNMPLENREQYGRIKDALPFVLGATNAKLGALITDEALIKQADHLGRSVDAVRQTLEALSAAIAENHDVVSKKIHNLTEDLDYALPKMGLEADQEQFIIDRIDKTFIDISALIDKSQDLKTSLAGIVRLLQQLALQQRNLLSGPTPNSSDNNDDGNEFIGDGDVELF